MNIKSLSLWISQFVVIHEDEYDTFYKLFLKIDVGYHAREK